MTIVAILLVGIETIGNDSCFEISSFSLVVLFNKISLVFGGAGRLNTGGGGIKI